MFNLVVVGVSIWKSGNMVRGDAFKLKGLGQDKGAVPTFGVYRCLRNYSLDPRRNDRLPAVYV